MRIGSDAYQHFLVYVAQSMWKIITDPGANHTIMSYNLHATSSLERFGSKNIFFYFEKRSSLLQR
jgi:hypothetical protein